MSSSLLFQNAIGKYVLLDGSYLDKYVAYATHAWYKSQNFTAITGTINAHDFSKDEEYMSFFVMKFRQTINELYGKHTIPGGNLIVGKDCKKTEIWRLDIFPEYKLHRIVKEYKDHEPNFTTVYQYAENTLWPQMQENCGFKIVRVPRCEADDILGVLCLKLSGEGNECIIVANDHDYHQLIRQNVSCEDFLGNNWNVNNTKAGRELLHKVLMGDRGDGVPGIHKRCGKVTADAYIDNREMLLEKLTKEPETLAQYKLNRQLVDLSMVPNEYKEKVISTYEQCQ